MEAIQETIDNLTHTFNSRMAEFQSELHIASTTNLPTVATLSADYRQFQSFVVCSLTDLQQQVRLLAQQQDHYEMRSRRKILLIHGIPEAKKEDVALEVVKVVAERLGLTDMTAADISRTHRLGRSTNRNPRPILVKFKSIDTKDRVWFNKTSLKGSGITLSEFLTKSRHQAFMAARDHFGVSKSWTRDGVVHIIMPNGSKKRVTTVAEVNRLAGISTPTVTAALAAGGKAAAVSETPKSPAGTGGVAVPGGVRSAVASAAAATATAARPKRGTNKK